VDLLLTDKVALVTGAGSGIGASIVGTLAQEGCVVYVTDLRLELAQNVDKDLREKGYKAFSVQMDVSDAEQVDQAIRQVVKNHRRLDILVNNAGILKTETIIDSSIQDWEEVTRGCYELAQEWLTNAENWGPTENRSNRGIRIPMRFFSRVHNIL